MRILVGIEGLKRGQPRHMSTIHSTAKIPGDFSWVGPQSIGGICGYMSCKTITPIKPLSSECPRPLFGCPCLILANTIVTRNHNPSLLRRRSGAFLHWALPCSPITSKRELRLDELSDEFNAWNKAFFGGKGGKGREGKKHFHPKNKISSGRH